MLHFDDWYTESMNLNIFPYTMDIHYQIYTKKQRWCVWPWAVKAVSNKKTHTQEVLSKALLVKYYLTKTGIIYSF